MTRSVIGPFAWNPASQGSGAQGRLRLLLNNGLGQVWALSCDDWALHATWEFASQTSPEAGMRSELGSVTTTCPGFPGEDSREEKVATSTRSFLLLCPFRVRDNRHLGLDRCCHALWDRLWVRPGRAQLLHVENMLGRAGVKSFKWKVGKDQL